MFGQQINIDMGQIQQMQMFMANCSQHYQCEACPHIDNPNINGIMCENSIDNRRRNNEEK